MPTAEPSALAPSGPELAMIKSDLAVCRVTADSHDLGGLPEHRRARILEDARDAEPGASTNSNGGLLHGFIAKRETLHIRWPRVGHSIDVCDIADGA